MGDDWSDDETPARDPSPVRESRGRGRGGAGGGGGDRGCFKCGESGHMSRECPNQDQSDRSRGCYKCGEEGHMSRDCPNQDQRDSKPKGCFKCGEEGHMSRDCPNQDQRDSKPKGCFKCGEEGHMSRECPTGGGGDRSGGSGCRKCGEEGHFARECPQAGEDGGAPRSRGCFNCGEEGHMSKDCTNERKENPDRPKRLGADGEEIPTERYVPPEMLEGDAIFQERKEVFEGSGINFSKYEAIPHSVSGDKVEPSVDTFEGLKLRPIVLENVKKCGYERPTPIQKHGSPQLMAGRHVMCCAQTGSGKTAAFLLPIINNLLNHQEGLSPANTSPARPEAVILAPTRELAIQIGNEANMYASGSIVKTAVVYGGAVTFSQKGRLMKGANIIVATTGRLKQFVRDGIIELNNVRFFVLDEADRMLDMGFMPDVREIVEKLPAKEDRVSGMFSATFPTEIQVAAKEFLHDYIYIVIGVVGGACKDVEQEIIQVEKSDKRKKIMEILKEAGKETKVLIFCASKKGADFLATHLSTNNVSCTSIHGDRLQSQREQALREFTLGKRQVLVATAVAARGLDIPKVNLVVNYDLPSEIDEYVHRIGRTGRVGHTGKSISFYDDGQDSSLASSLVSILKGAGQEVPDFLGSSSNGYGGGFQEGDFSSTDVRNKPGGGAAPAASGGGDDDDEW